MKRKYFPHIFITLGFSIFTYFIFIVMMFVLSDNITSKNYNTDISNYEDFEAVIDLIRYRNDNINIYLSDINSNELRSRDYFYFNKETSNILISNGILDENMVGKTIKFNGCLRDYGGGFDYSFASIEIDGKIYLPFEDGYNNIISSHNSSIKSCVVVIIVFFSLFFIFTLALIILVKLHFKNVRLLKNKMKSQPQ